MIKLERKCPECFSRGITVTFETGNELRKHRRTRHPKTTAQKTAERQALKKFRKAAIIAIIAAAQGTK